MTVMYRIRNKEDHTKFVIGTPGYNSYDSIGRIFPTIGKLRAFISGCLNGTSGKSRKVHEWEIVEVELVDKQGNGIHEITKPEKLVELLKK